MKKALVAMLLMALLVIPLGGLWTFVLRPVIGGGVEQSFIYPIYIGLIVLAGIVVGCSVILYDELKSLRKEVADLKEALKTEQEPKAS